MKQYKSFVKAKWVYFNGSYIVNVIIFGCRSLSVILHLLEPTAPAEETGDLTLSPKKALMGVAYYPLILCRFMNTDTGS